METKYITFQHFAGHTSEVTRDGNRVHNYPYWLTVRIHRDDAINVIRSMLKDLEHELPGGPYYTIHIPGDLV